jgi:hypothetical protein
MEAPKTKDTALGSCRMEPFEESSGRPCVMLSSVPISLQGAEGKNVLNIAEEGRIVK